MIKNNKNIISLAACAMISISIYPYTLNNLIAYNRMEHIAIITRKHKKDLITQNALPNQTHNRDTQKTRRLKLTAFVLGLLNYI